MSKSLRPVGQLIWRHKILCLLILGGMVLIPNLYLQATRSSGVGEDIGSITLETYDGTPVEIASLMPSGGVLLVMGDQAVPGQVLSAINDLKKKLPDSVPIVSVWCGQNEPNEQLRLEVMVFAGPERKLCETVGLSGRPWRIVVVNSFGAVARVGDSDDIESVPRQLGNAPLNADYQEYLWAQIRVLFE